MPVLHDGQEKEKEKKANEIFGGYVVFFEGRRFASFYLELYRHKM